MSRYQLKLLVLSLVAIVLIVVAAFAIDWFVVDLAGSKIRIDMLSAHACSPTCVEIPLGKFKGIYPTLVGLAFWCALPLLAVVALQSASRTFTGTAYPLLAKLGYALGAGVFLAGFAAGYLFAPESLSMSGFTVVTVDRTWAPLLMLVGSLAAMLALRYALLDELDDNAGEYKPVVIDRDRSRLPVTPLSVNKLPTPAPDPEARTRAPSSPPLGMPPRARTSSSGPIDVAARLGGAPLEITMRPPLPEPVAVPPDQIAVAPESGLTIRKRTASAGPISSASLPITSTKPKLRGRVSFALTTAAFSGAGITANREDGLARLVKWSEVVGIVARRMPPVAPYDGATFIDIVSTAGATLRILPWTDVTGHPVDSDPVVRARSLVQLLAAQCLDAKLDNATKLFANGTGNAAQLPDEKTLLAHDRRLA